MDNHTLRVLEFDKILAMAAAFATTVPGREVVLNMRPMGDAENIRQHINLVSECRKFLSEGRSLGIEHYEDIRPLLQRIRPADSVLEPFHLRSFLPFFYSALNLRLLVNDPSCERIGKIVFQLTTHPDIKQAIVHAIDREGKLKDEASPELSYIRESIKSCKQKIRKILEGILNQKDLAPHLQDYYLAERNNRWVIPVKIDSKGSVQGIVHDISNTGETVYIEPYSIQHLGNELESYRAEEKLEEYRILRMISSLLRERLLEIEADYRIVADIDALQAVSMFSGQMSMSAPEVNETGNLKITGGRHPLLWKTLRKANQEKNIVPLDIVMGRDCSCTVITGSNAGGKTVALKTIGVLNIMALSGLHVPAGSGTTLPFLESLFADIGDEQSIEQNLSTFSAHIKRISEIIQKSSSRTLIIIDELGTGTDPEQGGALSCAVLKKLQQKGATSIVSTHLGMLKAFAHTQQGMLNSAMEMKEVSLNGVTRFMPTFKLVVGEPGTSYAIEIAESLGLHGDVIRDARGIISGEGVAFESLISDLKQKNSLLDNKLREVDEIRRDTERLRSELRGEISRIESFKKTTFSCALKEAEGFLVKAKREAREVIHAIKKSSVKETSEHIRNLETIQKEIKELKDIHSPVKTRKLGRISKGKRVFVNTLGAHGTVHSVHEKSSRCRVIVHEKEFLVSFNDLSEPAEGRETEKPSAGRDKRESTQGDISVDLDAEQELNVIGQRVDPALSLVERYLNDVSLSQLNRVKIIHGIGSGILSRAIRDFLKDHPLVENFRKGKEDEGGDAVTVVEL